LSSWTGRCNAAQPGRKAGYLRGTPDLAEHRLQRVTWLLSLALHLGQRRFLRFRVSLVLGRLFMELSIRLIGRDCQHTDATPFAQCRGCGLPQATGGNTLAPRQPLPVRQTLAAGQPVLHSASVLVR
jgi:hypothetical protein